MEKKINFHTHTVFCDGKNTCEENILSAIEKGFFALGFSSHSYGFSDFDFGKSWHIVSSDSKNSFERHEEYINLILSLSEKYKDKIKIFSGFEVDYIKNVWAPERKNYINLNPDFLIGSVHYIFKDENEHFSVDAKTEEVEWALKKFYKNNGKELVQEYFALEKEMIKNGDFEILGHPDLVRKRNDKLNFFNENENWYIDEIKEVAKLAANAGVIVEINSGGLARGAIDDFYPSETFLKFLFEYGVPVCINSDAHSVEHLDFAFDRAISVAKKIGYKELVYPKIGSVSI